MSNQDWERTTFLILFSLVIAAAAWILLYDPSADIDMPSQNVAVVDNTQVDNTEVTSNIQPITTTVDARKPTKAVDKAQAKPQVKPKPRKVAKINIPVFASKLDADKPFTAFNSWSDLIVIERGPDWSKVASAKGLPVWISASLVKKVGNSHVVVTANSANLRSIPTVQGSRVLGRARAGDVMKISRKQGEWLRVWSPLRITAWAKSTQLVPQKAVSSSVETAM